jgi:hypothetical protein
MDFEVSHFSSMGIISLAEIVPKHIPYPINDMSSEPTDDQLANF